MRNLDQIKEQLKTQPDGQLSMTDPDARSMATSGKGSGRGRLTKGATKYAKPMTAAEMA
jgi:hypothetical protein